MRQKTSTHRIESCLKPTDFPQFIDGVSTDFERRLSGGSKEEDWWLMRSMVVYCNAQASLLLLVANIPATLQATGCQRMFIQNSLNGQRANAIQTLGSLSHENYKDSHRGRQDLDDPSVAKKPAILWAVVEEFRESLGMTKMPELDSITEKVT